MSTKDKNAVVRFQGKSLVGRNDREVKVRVKLMAQDAAFLNKNVRNGNFTSVEAVITGCMRKVRRDMAAQEIAALRDLRKKESDKVHAIAATMRKVSGDSRGKPRPKKRREQVALGGPVKKVKGHRIKRKRSRDKAAAAVSSTVGSSNAVVYTMAATIVFLMLFVALLIADT